MRRTLLGDEPGAETTFPHDPSGEGEEIVMEEVSRTTTRAVGTLLAAVAAVALGAFVLAASPAWAANIVVDSAQDNATAGDGACTLREAIDNANDDDETTGGDCAPGSGEDAITFDLGPSATITLGSELPFLTDDQRLSIDGEGDEITVSGNDAVRVLTVSEDAELVMERMTVANASGALGSGLDIGGTVTLRECTFSNNSASEGGGAIYNDGGTLTVSDSTFSNNSSGGDGGAIRSSGRLEISNSTFSGNSAGDDSDGGAINVLSPFDSTTITGTTITANRAPEGRGAGVAVSFAQEQSRIVVRSSIIAGNSTTDVDFRDSNIFVSEGYNVIGDGNAAAAFSQPSDQVGVADPLLGPLADNGGPTETHAPQLDSPATDRGDDGSATPTTDQRGLERPYDYPDVPNAPGGDGSDAGSFERNPGTVQFDSATYTVNEGAGNATITVTRSAGASGSVQVDYATSNGSATAGQDYATASGTLTFAEGDDSEAFIVPITDDARDESGETVNLTLSDPQGGATLGSPSSAVLTIKDDEPTRRCTRTGTEGDDEIRGTKEPDAICGLGGDDTLSGARGDDELYGDAGEDAVSAGKGDDTVRAADGEADTVECGRGDDTVEADPVDTVSRDCEEVSRG